MHSRRFFLSSQSTDVLCFFFLKKKAEYNHPEWFQPWKISYCREVHDSMCAGEHSFAQFEWKLKWQIMSQEGELKRLIIPTAVQSKSGAALSLSRLSSIVLLSENSEGPRCQFRLENDSVTLPMPPLLLAQLYHNSQAIRISINGHRWIGPRFY